MAEGNKNLEIGVVVNEGQMSKFNRAIQDATREVNKLAEALNRASNTFKGFLSGAGVSGGGAGGMTFRPGSGFAKTPGAASAGGGISQPAVAIASAIRSSAKESTDALRVMDQGVRTTSSKMASNLDVLDRALQNVEKRFKSIRSLSGPGGGPNPSTMNFSPNGIENRGGIDYAKAGPAVPPTPTTLERMTNRLFQPVFGGGGAAGGGGGGGPTAGGLFRGAAQQLGIPSWAIGAAGASGAILGGYAAFTSGVVQRESAVSNEVLASQTDFLRRQAAMQGSLGNLGMRVMRDPLAQYTAGKMGYQGLHAAFSGETMRAMTQQAWKNSGSTGTLPDVSKDVWDRLGALGAQITGSDLPFNNTIQKSTRDRLLNDIKMQMASRGAEMFDLEQAKLTAEERTYIPEFHQSAGGMMSRLRGLGRSGVKRNKKTGVMSYDAGAAMDVGLYTPYYEDEISGMSARIGGIAGMGSRGEGLAVSMLGATYGGLTNAPELYSAGIQYGNRGFAGTAIGGVGVDPTATSSLANTVMQSMMGGNYSIGGSAALQGMGAAFSTGGPGGDLRMARMAGAGVSTYDAMLSGSTDNLQKAINVLSANRAAPGMSIQAKHALEGISSVQLMEIMRSGKMPIELERFGITPKMVSNYLTTQSSFAYSRYITGTGAGGDVEAAVAGARSAGGAGKYIMGLLEHKKFTGTKSEQSRARIQFIQDQALNLGIAQHAMGMAPTNEAGTARVLMELGQSTDLFPTISGGGASDSARNSAAAAAKITDDMAKKAQLDWIRKHPEVAQTANDQTQAVAGAYGQAAIDGDMGRLHQTLINFVGEIKSATEELKRRGAANPKTSAP